MKNLTIIAGTMIVYQLVSGSPVWCEQSAEIIGEGKTTGEAASLIAEDVKNREFTIATEKLIDYINQNPGGDYLDQAYYHLGRCYEYENIEVNPDKWINAIQSYKRLIEEYSDSIYSPTAKSNIGRIYLHGGEYEQAIVYLEQAVANDTLGNLMANALYFLARSYQAVGREEDAKRIYYQITNDYPDRRSAIQSQKALEYLASTRPEERKPFPRLYRLNGVVIPQRTDITYQSEIKLDWEAAPEYSNDVLIPENLVFVKVTFFVKESSAQWRGKSTSTGVERTEIGKQKYEIRWDKGPGPFEILIDRKTGKPSRDEVTGEATVIIKTRAGDIVGQSDSKTFIFSDYIQSLRSE